MPTKQPQTSNNYDALRDFLRAERRDDFVLTFEQIEELLDFALPRAAQRASWWDTEREPPMPQRVACLDADFIASRGSDGASVRFKRKRKPRSFR